MTSRSLASIEFNPEEETMNFLKTATSLTVVAMASTIASSTFATAQEYPERPITLIVPFSPGGSTDLIGRIVADKASEHLGQPLVFEHRPGAGTMLALNQLAMSEPDGYTIGMTTSTLILQPLYGDAQFNYPEELQPLAQLAVTPPMFVTNAGAGWETVEELIEFATENPGVVKYGISGIGNASHLGVAALGVETGVQMDPVSYPGGAQLQIAVLGNHIPLATGSPVDYKDRISSGEIRGLVTFGPDRSTDPVLSDIPTAKELGFDIEITSWTGVSAPGGMPDDIVLTLTDAFGAALQDPDVQQAISDLGSTPQYLSASDFGERWKQDQSYFLELVTETGILDMLGN